MGLTIKDLALMPFEIAVDENNYTLYKNGETKEGKPKQEVIGHFSVNAKGMESLVKKVVHTKLLDREGVITLSGFLNEYAKQSKVFTDLLEKILK